MDFVKRAISLLQGRFPRAVVLHKDYNVGNCESGASKTFYVLVAFDPDAAVRQSMIAVPELGEFGELSALARDFDILEKELISSVEVRCDNAIRPVHAVSSKEMVQSPRILVYTDHLLSAPEDLLEAFRADFRLIEIICEDHMLSSVFISFGGPDEDAAAAINVYLKRHGVKTWFFPDDAQPGDKLHRTMSDGIASHDRVLLICSKASLSRPGLLNELERVLEREAKEGGSDILIPISLDDYVFKDWSPPRRDIADQIRSRVIATLSSTDPSNPDFKAVLDKVVKVLQGKR